MHLKFSFNITWFNIEILIKIRHTCNWTQLEINIKRPKFTIKTHYGKNVYFPFFKHLNCFIFNGATPLAVSLHVPWVRRLANQSPRFSVFIGYHPHRWTYTWATLRNTTTDQSELRNLTGSCVVASLFSLGSCVLPQRF